MNKKLTEKEFKKLYRKDECSKCPKRIPCGIMDGICPLVTPCVVCEIKDTCTSLCDQMSAYLNRGVRGNPEMVTFDEELTALYDLKTEDEEAINRERLTYDDIPWEILSSRDKQILIDHFYFNKGYEQISKDYSISVARAHHIIHGSSTNASKGGIDKIKEHFEYQQLYNKYEKLIPKQMKEILHLYYVKNESMEVIAQKNSSIWNTYKILEKGRKFLKNCSKNC